MAGGARRALDERGELAVEQLLVAEVQLDEPPQVGDRVEADAGAAHARLRSVAVGDLALHPDDGFTRRVEPDGENAAPTGGEREAALRASKRALERDVQQLAPGPSAPTSSSAGR